MLKPEVAAAMTEVLKDIPAGRLLETGTGWGESAAFFGALLPAWNIYTVDGFGIYGDGRIYSTYNHEQVKKINEALPVNVIQILGNSQNIRWELPLDFLFIDADHTYRGCVNDFNRYSPFVKSGRYICFDDYTQPNNPANGVKDVIADILKGDMYTLHYEGYYCVILKKL